LCFLRQIRPLVPPFPPVGAVAAPCRSPAVPHLHNQPAQAGVSRGTRTSHVERTGAQLSHGQQRDDSHDEPNQIPVSQLGDSVCWHHGLCCAPSPPVVGQDRGTRSSGARRTFV